MRKFSILILALAMPLTAHAELYKWTDSSGKVHYSDQKPTDRKSQSILNTSPASPAAPKEQSQSAPKSLADKELEFNKRRKEAQEAAAKREKEEADARIKQQNCERSRATLQSLQRGERMSIANEKGETVVMDDKLRQQETERARQQVDTWCK